MTELWTKYRLNSIAQHNPDSSITYHHHDQLGSTRLLTNTTGAEIGAVTYNAFGKPTATTGQTTPFGFAGQYTDTETGFQYLRARYYDPATGQLLIRNPIETPETRG